MTSHRPRSRMLASACLALLLPLTACSGEEGGEDSPEDVLAEAKSQLDETSGVELNLATEELPDGVDGVLRATGVGTNAPAFEGDLTVLVNNLTVDVPVVSVNGQVFAKLPFTTKFAEINPADYGAPDPAGLMADDGGLSSWLTAAEDVEEGDQVREGDKVLTTYTGTLPGESVATVIPSADAEADFAVTFRIDDDGLLDSAQVVGPFYGEGGDVDYTISLRDYGTQKDIAAP